MTNMIMTANMDFFFLYKDFLFLLFQSVLQKVIAGLDWCLTNSPETNPSEIFGQCLYHSTKLPCTKQGGVRMIIYSYNTFDIVTKLNINSEIDVDR